MTVLETPTFTKKHESKKPCAYRDVCKNGNGSKVSKSSRYKLPAFILLMHIRRGLSLGECMNFREEGCDTANFLIGMETYM